MKAKLISAWDRVFIIETINNQLKNVTQIKYSHHRSAHSFMLNLTGKSVACCLTDNKASIEINYKEF